MRIKSYLANSVEGAVRQARDELGADAVLIESHAAPIENRHLGRFEVVFGILEGAQQPPLKAKRVTAPTVSEDVASELKLLRSQIDELRRVLHPDGEQASGAAELEAVRQELIAADLDPEIAEEMVDSARSRWAAATPGLKRPGIAIDVLRQLVHESLAARMETAPGLIGNAVALIGPPGSGKTTTVAKLAIRYGLAQRLPVRLISVDTDRVGSHERLRAYSEIMGANFSCANSMAEFQNALKSGRKEWVLIDTPGFTAADNDSARELARAMSRVEGLETHLALPASMKRADLAAYSDLFAIFKPSRLLITKLDETVSAGSVISEVIRLRKPLSFVCNGQATPDDLGDASIEGLLAKFIPGKVAAAASAA